MEKHFARSRFTRGAYQLVKRYFDHRVARDSAALTYYLLFAIFPLLIFLSNLVGILQVDVVGFLYDIRAFIPQDAIDIIEQYMLYVSRDSSRQLLWFSLVFSIYFPYRAANALMGSVRKAYGIPKPTRFLRNQLKLLLYTLCLIFIIVLSIAFSVFSRRVLNFISGYIALSDAFIELWSDLRFVALGLVLFFVIALLYALAQETRQMYRIWPGVIASLAMWMALSLLFSFYVENVARYSVIYGTLGAVVVLLLWLYLAAMMLILGAEFNAVIMSLRNRSEEDSEQ